MKVSENFSRQIDSPRDRILLAFGSIQSNMPAVYNEGTYGTGFVKKQKGEFLKMKAQKLFLLLIAIIIFPGLILSQDNDFTFKNGRSNLENTLQTDGYGINGSNSYLSGLGTQSDYVSIQHDPELSQAADASIEAWIYVTDLSTVNYILVKGNQQGTCAYAFYINTDGKPAIRFGNLNLISNGPSVPTNTWTHVAVTWEDPGDIEVKFYIDGEQAGTNITTPGSVNVNTSEVRIGVAEFGNEGFGGYIDEVRLWGGVITPQQIRQNRFVGLGEKPASNFDGTNFSGSVNYDGLVASWTFNPGAGTWTWEYIGGHYGVRHGGASISTGLYSYPMPYNNVLYFPGTGGDDNYVILRDTSIFSQTMDPDGTIDMWVRMDQMFPAVPVAFVSKGATSETSSFYLGLSGGGTGKLVFRIGSTTVVSDGPSLPPYSWNHVAVSWLDIGAGYSVKFFLNGELNDSLYLNRNSMPNNTDPIRIGESQGFPADKSPVNTYIDELRFWDEEIPAYYIEKVMFASTDALKTFFEDELMAAWSFDGNMIPQGRFNKMRGTFDNGNTNNVRYSSFYNEGSFIGNVLSNYGMPHITVMKSEDPTEHTFPLGFYQETPFDTIPYNGGTGLNSVINVGPSFPDNNLSSVELFMSVNAPLVEDYIITLTAPNGVSRTVMSNNGGEKHNILTIFTDDAIMGLNSSEYLAPYTNEVRPFQAFGNFNNSPARGNWTINIKQFASDNPTGYSPAVLNGWGIRLNGQTVTGIQNVTTEVPQRYELSQNYPNPFNPSTSIKFSIPKSGLVSLKVYDILGKEVATLVNKDLNSGSYEYTFDAAGFTSGVYFYRLEAGDFSEIKKMMLIK